MPDTGDAVGERRTVRGTGVAPRPTRRTAVALPCAALIVVAWGVLLFGGVYPWAYWPLLLGCAGVGFAAWVGAPNRKDLQVAHIAFACVLLGIALQLVPLPRQALAGVSPATHRFLAQTDLGYGAVGSQSGHQLSINPNATLRGLAFFVTLGLFVRGLAGGLTTIRIRPLIAGLTVLGTAVGTVGIIQKALHADHVYGFWHSQFASEPFGPFVNRNHFAGWIVLLLPLSLSYAWALMTTHGYRRHHSLISRFLWLTSVEASQSALAGFACGVMILALGMTLSRSGIVAGTLAIAFLAIGLSRRSGLLAKMSLGAFAIGLISMGLLWDGSSGKLSQRFGEFAVSPLGGRLGAWNDALGVIRQFPLFGSGLNTYGTAMTLYQHHDLARHYAEAHNDYLQLAAEGGLLVSVPAAVSLIALAYVGLKQFRAAASDPFGRAIRMGALAGLLGIALQEISDFSLQMPGNAVLGCVLLSLFLRRADTAGYIERRA